MNEIIKTAQNNLPTGTIITLKDITDLISVQHSKALERILKLSSEPLFGEVSLIDTSNSNGVTIKTLALTKKQAIAAGAKLNNSLLMKVINRLEELETNTPIKLPSKTELAKMVIESEEKLLIANNRLKAKDEVILAVADLNIKAGDVSIGDFAKNLAIDGMGRNNMYTWLKGRGFLMMNNEPFQRYVERGYMKRKPYDEKYGGEIRYKTVLTPRGTVWLAKIIRAEFEIDEDNL